MSIQPVEDHPDDEYVATELIRLSTGNIRCFSAGPPPLRMQSVLDVLGFSAVDARSAVRLLLHYPMESPPVTPNPVLYAYKNSAEKTHDVYDCFYFALARGASADAC